MARTYISVLVLQKNTAKSTIHEIQQISCMKSSGFHVKSGRFHAKAYIYVLVLQINTAKPTIHEIQWISCMKFSGFHVKNSRFHAMVKYGRFHT